MSSKLSELFQRASLEGEGGDFAGNEEDLELANEVPDTEIQAAEVVNDVANLQTEVQEENEAAEALESHFNHLCRVQSALEDFSEEGGMSRDAARMTALSLESIERDLGISKPVIPSLENFGGSASRERTTTLSIESVGDVASKVWEAIKRAFAQVIKLIQDVFKKVTFAARRLKGAALKTAQAARGAKNGSTDQKISIGGQKNLFINGEYQAKGWEAISTTSERISKTYPSLVASLIDQVSSTIDNPSQGQENTKKAIGSFMKGISSVFTKKLKETSNGPSEMATESLPGNKALVFSADSKITTSVSGKDADIIEKFSTSVKLNLEDLPDAKAAPESYDASVPSASEIVSNMNAISKTTDSLSNGESAFSKVRKSMDASLSKLKNIKFKRPGGSKGDSEGTAEKGESTMISDQGKTLAAARKLVGTGVTGYYSHSLSVLNAYVALGNRQVAALTKGGDKS